MTIKIATVNVTDGEHTFIGDYQMFIGTQKAIKRSVESSHGLVAECRDCYRGSTVELDGYQVLSAGIAVLPGRGVTVIDEEFDYLTDLSDWFFALSEEKTNLHDLTLVITREGKLGDTIRVRGSYTHFKKDEE